MYFGYLHIVLSQVTEKQPFNEGTIVFETKSVVDWQEFDRLVTQPALAEIDSLDISKEEKESKRKEYEEFGSPKELLKRFTGITTTMEVVFSGNFATAEKTTDGKKEDNFFTYQLDSMHTTWYYFNHKGALAHNTVISTPEAAVRWSQITNSVRVDSADTKEILGFPCVKYHLAHSHVTDLGNGRTASTPFRYELYVTSAIELPFFLIDPAITEKVFNGCALEIKYINDSQPYSYSITRATNFSPNVLKSRLEIPERFKN